MLRLFKEIDEVTISGQISAERIIEYLKPLAFESGISHKDFWEMSVAEITERIAAENRRQARIIYQNALLTGIAVNNPVRFPQSLNAAFPKLFGGEDRQANWKESKEFMKRFQKEQNKAKRRLSKNDG